MGFVQAVHYPLYSRIKEGFVDYEREHIRRTGVLVAPLMFFEALSAIFLCGMASSGIQFKLMAVNLIILILIWVLTLLFQVNQHQKLAIRFSPKIYQRLLGTNWLRLILWITRGVILSAALYLDR